MSKTLKLIGLLSMIAGQPLYAETCEALSGHVIELQAIYQTPKGFVKGFSRPFCQFHLDDGQAIIGLETFETKSPNIAASYVLNLEELDENSPLWQGKAPNPSHRVCQNLGGSMLSYSIPGSFTGKDGEYDICTFGDGSMISAWTLIYIANHRNSFDIIKNNIPSSSLFD